MLLFEAQKYLEIVRNYLSLLESFVSGKLGCRVRKGVVGKALLDSNSLATYPTCKPARGCVNIRARY